jgi:hypothetical protein
LENLAREFNDSIQNGQIKEEWLHSYLLPLPKPNKDHSKINGYRIITMHNTAGKLLERIAARWLASDLEQRGKLPPTLGGYGLNKETWLNAAVFAHNVYEGFQVYAETCAAAIDLEDAYNRVPFKYLIRMLLGLDVHPIIIRWIAAALFQRKVVLRCGSWVLRASDNMSRVASRFSVITSVIQCVHCGN